MTPHPYPIYMSFLWGAATSSHQVEGGNRFNDWWAWEEAGKVENQETSGDAVNHWEFFKEDLQHAKRLQLNSYRFSLEWSRLEPREGEWDESAESRYVEIIDTCEALGLLPLVSLHHFTLPQWVANQGGLCNDQFPLWFQRFVLKVCQKIGRKVPLWCTINEPIVLALGQYLGGFMPPAEFSPVKLSLACRQLLESHVLAYETLHTALNDRIGRWKSDALQVGFAHNMLDFLPSRRWHPVERLITWRFHRFYNCAWLDAVTGGKQHFGVPGVVPRPSEVKGIRGKKTADFIGINYYTKCCVRWGKRAGKTEFSRTDFLPIGVDFSQPGDVCSDLGWAIHPVGLRRILNRVRRYQLPIYITENGIADRDDSRRSSFLREHIDEIDMARRHGIDVRGYFHWSLLDNFEWVKGFEPRFGLVEVAYDSLARTIRPSALDYSKIIEIHQRP